MPKEHPVRETITVAETARLLGVHPETVKIYLRKKWLRGRKKGLGLTNTWFVYRDSIDEFIRKSENLPH